MWVATVFSVVRCVVALAASDTVEVVKVKSFGSVCIHVHIKYLFFEIDINLIFVILIIKIKYLFI